MGGSSGSDKAAKREEKAEQAQLRQMQAQQRAKSTGIEQQEITTIKRAGGGFGGTPQPTPTNQNTDVFSFNNLLKNKNPLGGAQGTLGGSSLFANL